MAVHVRAMLEFWRRGVPTFDYGNNIRQMAKEPGVDDAFDFPGFVPAYIRPLFCRGRRPIPLGGTTQVNRRTSSARTRRSRTDAG